MRASRPHRRLVTIGLSIVMAVAVSVLSAGRAMADVGLEQDPGDGTGGPDYSWSTAYDVSFVDFADGWDFYDPSADIPSFSNVPPPPAFSPTSSNPPCLMSAVSGFDPDTPPLPMGHTYDIWVDGNLAGSYTCVPASDGGWAILWADGNNQNVTVVPLVW